MSGLPLVFLLILFSAIPSLAVFIWFRLETFAFSARLFLCCLLSGAAAFVPALFLQYCAAFFFGPAAGYRESPGSYLLKIFAQVALTEELARLIMLLIFFAVFARLQKSPHGGEFPGRVTAIGFVSGMGFAFAENAAYGAASFGVLLPRLFTASLIHAACGARVAGAAVNLRNRTSRAVLRFLSAIAIHGMYNFMISMSGLFGLLGILIALFAFSSAAIEIRIVRS
jgi:RsiW-degrading membrane proteinase PrsW (M82 family)